MDGYKSLAFWNGLIFKQAKIFLLFPSVYVLMTAVSGRTAVCCSNITAMYNTGTEESSEVASDATD